ncbi:MAG TPA: PH domain-containing protein [Candidatus Eisenbacteria bacterium]|nr:PH domain-containing protein [Candidatus Eisenbacteria bacterium]
MGYIQRTLIAGESVLYRAHLHWVVLFGHALTGALGMLLGLGLVAGTFITTGNDLGPRGGTAAAIGGVLLFGAGFAVLLIGILKRAATEIAVTNKRVLIKTGFFGRKTIEIFLSKIESVVVDETFLGKTLGFGTVTVRGTGGTPERFDRVADPLEFRRQVQTQIEGSPTQIRTA